VGREGERKIEKERSGKGYLANGSVVSSSDLKKEVFAPPFIEGEELKKKESGIQAGRVRQRERKR